MGGITMQAPPYSLRLDKESMDKIKVLAAEGRRSVNMQLCIAVETYLKDYEKEHGEIAVTKE